MPLSRGLKAVIDVADLPLVKGYTWYAHQGAWGEWARTND